MSPCLDADSSAYTFDRCRKDIENCVVFSMTLIACFQFQLPAQQLRQQRVAQGGEGSGFGGVGFYLRHQRGGEFVEAAGDVGRRDGEPEVVEALGRDALATAGAGHVLDGVGAQRVGAGEEVAELWWKRRLRREDDVFGRAPADLAVFEEIDVAGLAVLQAGRDAGKERVAVLKLGARAEFAVDDFLGGMALRRQVLHVEVGRDGSAFQDPARIDFDGVGQALRRPTFGNVSER